MESQDHDGADVPFRLRGEVDDKPCVFDLKLGEYRVGSSSGSDLRLRQPGVSRQHALLVVQAEGLVVEDRGSRNGTFVDGRKIQRAAATGGTELRFGPVSLVLESLAEEEGTLAISLDPSKSGIDTRSPSSSLWPEVTALQSSRSSASADATSLRLVDEIGSALAGGDLEAGLRCLGETLHLRGCCFVELPKSGPPIVRSSWGLIPDSPPRDAFDPPTGFGSGARVGLGSPGVGCGDPGNRPRIVVARDHRGSTTALVLWGWDDEPPGEPVILRILARSFSSAPSAARGKNPEQVPKTARRPPLDFPPGYVEGSSPPLLTLYRQLERLAPRDLPILLTGPTGVGKGVVAAVLHRSSPRVGKPLIAVNCAALPGELLEAELFGIGKGVATGVEARQGHFSRAQGGTLFLDEIAELPLALQAKLLRALEEKEIQPLGAPAIKIDIRILAATNADLRQRVREGTFRQDLYFRLAGYVLEIPPLSDCREDLPRLAEHFLRRFAEQESLYPQGLSLGALRQLVSYSWPGNIRELEHEMRRLVLRSSPGQILDSSLLSSEIRKAPGAASPPISAGSTGSLGLKQRLEALEESLIQEALEAADGVQLHAAQALGISRNGLARRLKRLGQR